ncbi:MAG: hypothetical protein U5L09_02655 [Bacteroidales bacterium]|nr:hypothetical protein [Bacteroidales bacterium]
MGRTAKTVSSVKSQPHGLLDFPNIIFSNAGDFLIIIKHEGIITQRRFGWKRLDGCSP